MLIAMAVTAALCIGIGVFPAALYSILPYAVAYEPYTASHVTDQLQLLVFSAMAFSVLVRTGIYPPELRSVNLESDWVYRRLAPSIAGPMARGLSSMITSFGSGTAYLQSKISGFLTRWYGPGGILAGTWPTGSMALWVMVLLLAYLLVYYL